MVFAVVALSLPPVPVLRRSRGFGTSSYGGSWSVTTGTSSKTTNLLSFVLEREKEEIFLSVSVLPNH